ncbi:FG-GAP repeat protein, partial [Romeria aff. gracilis LEGE 07310]|nr:FG-GAP repeat protein [Romeria aff. gracilis LEGE 07310]
PNGSYSGESYVVFGGSAVGNSGSLELSSLNGSNGFVLNGIDAGDLSGRSVSGAGDLNGDGIDDLIIGADGANPNGGSSGESYVVFGRRANQAPTITSPDSNSVPENQTTAIDVETSDDTDSEGSGLTYSLTGGVDAALFNIDASSGVVSFNSAPDFENPQDSGSDNTYNLEVSVTDSGGLSDSQALAIEVVPTVNGKAATIYVNTDNIVVGNAFQAGQSYEGDLFSNTDAEFNSGKSPDDVIAGTDGDDNIWSGSEGNDTIGAKAGNDIIGISDGDTYVEAGSGNDFVYAAGNGAGDNTIDLGSGDDDFWAPAGNHTLTGSGNNTIGLGTGNDSVSTGSGDDFIYTVNGGGGVNSLDLGDGENTVYLENGNYSITSGSGSDSLGLGTGTDSVDAGDGDNIIYMLDPDSAGNKDILTGAGDDYIETGAGDDLLNGGLGNVNTLIGGSGADTFALNDGTYTYLSDFELGTDLISLMGGVSFEDLSFSQGSGERAADTLISISDNVVLQAANIQASALNDQNNFTTG